jgi:hypothetical protein
MSRIGQQIKFEWASPQAMPDVAPVYMGARYQSLFAAHDASEARLLTCRVGNRLSRLPLLVRQVSQETREAYSAYGYGGFFGDLTFAEKDVDGLRRYLGEAGIAALFLRHSPFLDNHISLPEGLSQLNRRTYAVALRAGETMAALLARVPQKLRWSANFALRSGLSVTFQALSECTEERILAFYREYASLMEEKGTSDYYRFSETFFLEHARRLGADCELAEVLDADGRFLGGAFFLLDRSSWVHYHLSAALREAMKLQGMELLMLSALQRYGERGYCSLHLGGGHALDEMDGLSRFKAKFADRKLDFYCSALVCDETAYARERARLPLAHPSYFLISHARGTSPIVPVQHARLERST